MSLLWRVLGVWICLAGSVAHAQSADDDAAGAEPGAALEGSSDESGQEQEGGEAFRLYRMGQLHYEGQEFAKAAETFAEAYALDPDEILAYNAARSYERSGDLKQAEAFYNKQLALSQEGDLADRARLALTRLLEQREALSRREADARRQNGFLNVRTDLSGEVLVDGALLGGTSDRHELAPGKYTVEVRRGDEPPQVRVVEIQAGQDTDVMVIFDDGRGRADLRAWSGFGLMGGGVVAGAAALRLNANASSDSASPRAVAITAAAFEVVGLGLLLWSVFDNEPAQVLEDTEAPVDLVPSGEGQVWTKEVAP